VKKINRLTRAELAALVVETLAGAGIEVVLVGGSCVCVYTNERFGSFDLDFIDLTYARKKAIAAALATIGFTPNGSWSFLRPR
jgi:predicted O-methyltransferase YrrM